MDFSESKLIAQYAFSSVEPILIDVGAHQGSVSRLFARQGWEIVAFEPEQRNREAFLERMAEFDHVTCIPKAVSDKTGERVPFYVSEEHFGIHTLKPFHPTHRFAYDVETVRLDHVLDQLEIPHVTFLKVDTEGADFLALKGFDFERYTPEIVMVEFMDSRSESNFSYTHHDMARYMQDRGYVAFISEWEPIKEYGRKGVKQSSHVWLQCVPYPLPHAPAWGNLIFVLQSDQAKFQSHLKHYVQTARRAERMAELKRRVKAVPGAQRVYRCLMGN